MFFFKKKGERTSAATASFSLLRKVTESWYNEKWPTIQKWVTELGASKVDTIFIENFLDEIPRDVDKKYICDIFNSDDGFWTMALDNEKSLVITRK